MANIHLRSAQAADKRETDAEKKIAELSKKLSDNANKQLSATKAMDSATKAATRDRDTADSRRRAVESAMLKRLLGFLSRRSTMYTRCES
jgi:molecular chaperone GrpE (heat shock protein)